MSTKGGLLGTLISPLFSVLFGKQEAPKPQVQQPVAQVRPNQDAANALLLRRGSKANQKTGMGGAEAASPPAGKTKLGA